MSFNIVADENIPALEHYLGAFGSVQRVNGRTLGRAQLGTADILLVRSVTRVDEALLAGSPVKFVGTATSGFDHIDTEYLNQHAIAFAHAPGSNANSVVEYVLAAIAAVGNTLEHLLAGGNVGIVGYGSIGKALAARLAALGICCRIYDPWLDQQLIPHAADLNAVLECDVVTLHPELTMQQPWPSHHLLGAAQLRRLRPATLLINASRGSVVDNTALLEILADGRGPRAVLDVWEDEPHISRALLRQVTLGSAHIAGYSLDGKLLATRMLSEAVAAHLQLRPPNVTCQQGAATALSVCAGWSAAELVRFLVQSRYDILRDDTLLRQSLLTAPSAADAGQRFDLLRKAYRERRELAGSRVTGVEELNHHRLVTGLGCVPLPLVTPA